MTTAAQQARIDALKSQIRSLDKQISALKPAEEAARIKTAAAQNALDAFQATPGVDLSDLIEAKAAAAANPNNAQLQQQLRITQESWDARQSQYLPLLRARDAAFEQEVATRRPIVDLESRQVDLEIEIVKIDPAQASPEAVAYAKELGEFPITNVDPAAAAIPQSTTPALPTQTSTVVANTTGNTNRLPAETGAQTPPGVPQSIGTAPLDDPEAGEYEARQRLLDQQPVESFAPPPVSDDNLAFEPQFDDNLAYASPPTVFEDPNAGDFEAQQFVTGSQIRAAPQAVTVIDPETGLPVETLASVEARQLAELQETGVSPYGEEDDPQELPADTDTTVEDTEGYIVPENNIPPDSQILRQPTALGGNYSAQYNIDNDWWEIVDDDTGEVVQTGIKDEAEATILAQEYSVGDPNFAGNADAAGGDPGLTPEQAQQQAAAQAAADAEARRQAAVAQLRAQATIEAQRKLANEGDWRVRLSLAQSADYLYLDPKIEQTGILYPLLETSGVVFPYTPNITNTYTANYTPYDLTHSNYRGYFYQNSNVGDISLECDFTAQDTQEANYLLAVIHFFRSVTKMFYGQDANRGQPPPLVFLQGFGEFQYNLHPCVVSSFNYTTPNDVDYIRARSVNVNGTDLLQRRNQASLPSGAYNASNTRLGNSGLPSGAETTRPAPPTLGTNRPTYVPTKISISITLLPMQTRQQVSKEFSLKEFANGNLVRKGFW
jgi:hypothetical protein